MGEEILQKNVSLQPLPIYCMLAGAAVTPVTSAGQAKQETAVGGISPSPDSLSALFDIAEMLDAWLIMSGITKLHSQSDQATVPWMHQKVVPEEG